ncbi:Thiazole synthase [Plesiomonas shigelloides]|uniref:thiazole synthase n=1 Tax=Plesiomonas shigelloides TaxID=703 RepID=UPI000D81A864|nr:thiazole synthase [Plesiomonas shigelloides]SPZ44780.1 Thiazole synthase [Plesiomonas shigelloides]
MQNQTDNMLAPEALSTDDASQSARALITPTTGHDELHLGGVTFGSRLLTGSGKFASATQMAAALQASGSELVTMALKRVDCGGGQDDILTPLRAMPHLRWLPNTSGARDAKEAILAAHLAREALGTTWLKLEIHPDPKYLLPDPWETLQAAEQLVRDGFTVLPYCHADPVLCKRLEEVGCAAVMPLGAPIGSNQGLQTQAFLRIIIEQANVPVIVDAGIGAPSQAAQAMELGADAVLVNTAIAAAADPVAMANAFRWAVQAGRQAYLAGLAGSSTQAQASSPLTGFWL